MLLEHSPRMVAVRGCESELALLTSGFCKFACLAKTFNLRSSNALCRYKSPRSLRSLAQLYKDRYQPPLPCAARALIAQGCSERLSAWVGAFDKWLLQFCFFGQKPSICTPRRNVFFWRWTAIMQWLMMRNMVHYKICCIFALYLLIFSTFDMDCFFPSCLVRVSIPRFLLLLLPTCCSWEEQRTRITQQVRAQVEQFALTARSELHGSPIVAQPSPSPIASFRSSAGHVRNPTHAR